MLILLTNDDGIYAPGLRALEAELRQLGEVVLVSPAVEQSGVGHSITFLSPLIAREEFGLDGKTRRGWAVEGSPADCVKLGIFEFCPRKPDLVVSGINGGLNAGINVLYSGTVAAAIEGAFFGLTSIAVSCTSGEFTIGGSVAGLAGAGLVLRNNNGDDLTLDVNGAFTFATPLPMIVMIVTSNLLSDMNDKEGPGPPTIRRADHFSRTDGTGTPVWCVWYGRTIGFAGRRT